MNKNRFPKKFLIPTLLLCLFIYVISIFTNSKDLIEPKDVYAASDTFNSSGTWAASTGIYAVDAECWGGGGGGGGSTRKNKTVYGGGGGGGGGYAKRTNISVTPGQGYQVIVGGSGSAGAVGGNGGTGGNSSFNTNSVIAVGGGGGGAGDTTAGTAGSGGTGSTGGTTYNGGNGAIGTTTVGGGGGEGSGSTSNGGNASGQTGGTGTDGGDGGNGGNSGANGNPGNIPGGAGGGAGKGGAPAGYAGGAGTPGRCIVTYVDTWAPSTNQTTYSPTWSFSSVPNNTSSSQISMTATTGYDFSTPIEYLFTLDTSSCPSGHAGTGGTSSSWQTNTSYSDTGLDANKCYGYTVKARDSLSNSGPASSLSYTYTSANTPGTPTLDNPTLYTLDLDNNSNGNPTTDPATLYAAQVTLADPNDSTWINKWIDGNGDPSDTEVWLTDSQMDNITMQNLNHTTEYGVQIKAKNENGDETDLSSQFSNFTDTLIISLEVISSGSVAYGIVPPDTPTSTLDLDPVATQEVQSSSNVNVDFKISSSDALDGGTGEDWVLGVTTGFYFKFSPDGGSIWTPFTASGSYETLAEDVTPTSSKEFDLQITVPTDPGDINEKTLTITVMAVESN